MNVIACQYDIAWEDKRANHDMLRRWLHERLPEPGSLIVLPEMFATGFSMNIARTAQTPERESERFLSSLAAELSSHVVAGVVNFASSGRAENQAVAFGPDGGEVARYAKLHPFSYAGEDEHFEAGGRLAVFDWQGLRVAPVVCYDLRFPELFRHAVRMGAELFAVIANWPGARSGHWRPLLRARAIENQAFVVGVNRTGRDPNVAYHGQSVVFDPHGRIVAQAQSRAELLEAGIDRCVLDEFRARFPALRDMRRDLLGPGPGGNDG